MDREQLATLIDAYADAKTSRNRYLMELMVKEMGQALDELFEAPQPQLDQF
jgi:hypothetical protein